MSKRRQRPAADNDHGHSHAHNDHDHSHSHSHGHDDHDHSHSHSHSPSHAPSHSPHSSHSHDHNEHDHSHSHSHSPHDHNEHDHSHSHGHGHAHDDHDHSHSHSHSHPSSALSPYEDHYHSHQHGEGCSHDHGHEMQPPMELADPLHDLSLRLASTHISTSNDIEDSNSKVGAVSATGDKIEYSVYKGEHQIVDIMALIDKDLSEPYSIYTYRYFINNWPQLCILATLNGAIIGVVVCKLDIRQRAGAPRSRGYIAMLAVDQQCRKLGIGSRLVREAIHKMILEHADEVVLETEITNKGALALYENLGFLRDKRLHKYYLNGGDAFRLILPLTPQFLNRNP